MIDHVTNSRLFPAQPTAGQTVERSSVSSEARHVLVPVTLSECDVPAVRLGLHMAAASAARLTVLHVGQIPLEDPSRNWLASIDRLHQSLSAAGVDGHALARAAADQLKAFVRSAGTASLVLADVSLIVRPGDFCDEVLRFARSADADVVILPGEKLQGWIPAVPSRLRRTLQQLGKRIVAVWPEATTSRLAWNPPRPALAH
jgi:K+-sensing histidine kinase KdpD